MVVRGLYQIPHQFRVSRNWFVLAGFCQAKMACPRSSLPAWTTANGLSRITPASLDDSKWLVRMKLCHGSNAVPFQHSLCHASRSGLDRISE